MWKCAKEANNSITPVQKMRTPLGANLLDAAVRKWHAKKRRRESEEGEMISILYCSFFYIFLGLFNSLLLTGQNYDHAPLQLNYDYRMPAVEYHAVCTPFTFVA